jgi:hypothetical protein
MKLKNILIIFCAFTTLLATSCNRSVPHDEYLYDKVGFAPSRNPNEPDPSLHKVVPNYYYRYGPTVPAEQGYAPQPQPQYYAPPQPQYAQPPYRAQPYQQQGGSRFYSNPYDVPPSQYYNQPYDADQYYVPPSYYYGVEQQKFQKVSNQPF